LKPPGTLVNMVGHGAYAGVLLDCVLEQQSHRASI
jgi:hypothetical protein